MAWQRSFSVLKILCNTAGLLLNRVLVVQLIYYHTKQYCWFTVHYSSLAESPECWNLELQLVQIFADSVLMFVDNLHIFARKCIINADKHINISGFLRNSQF